MALNSESEEVGARFCKASLMDGRRLPAVGAQRQTAHLQN